MGTFGRPSAWPAPADGDGALILGGDASGPRSCACPRGPGRWRLGIRLLLFLRVARRRRGRTALWPSLFASVSDRVEPGRQAQAMSVLNITYLVGIAFGPFVGGLINDYVQPRPGHRDPARYVPSFFVAAACFATAALLAYFVAPRRPTPPRHHPQDHHDEALGEGGAGGGAHRDLFAGRRAQGDFGSRRRSRAGFLTFLGIGLIARTSSCSR